MDLSQSNFFIYLNGIKENVFLPFYFTGTGVH